MTSLLITGANRGIGLGLTQKYLEDGATVHVTCRSPDTSDALQALKSRFPEMLHIHPCDVTLAGDLDALKAALKDVCLDMVINNAGIMGPMHQSSAQMDYEGWAEAFTVNSMAPLRVAQTFIDNLLRSDNPRLITVTSQMGQLSRQSSGSYAYRSSKAAANMVMHLLHLDLKDKGVICIPCHPGWVRTDMGGAGADISVDESVTGLKALFDNLSTDQSGRFWAWDGTELEW